jgi:protein-S-isoprenylcysteine O-methyltransferase Ste14
MNLLKSIFHNIGVLIVGFGVAYLGRVLDFLFGISNFHFILAIIVGGLFLAAGFLLRVWATYHFYQHQMKVIKLSPQNSLITSGPYRISRNPLYLGGNVFIFLGASLILGSPMALVITILHWPLMDLMVRREEKQLEKIFGGEWLQYKKHIRRWL